MRRLCEKRRIRVKPNADRPLGSVSASRKDHIAEAFAGAAQQAQPVDHRRSERGIDRGINQPVAHTRAAVFAVSAMAGLEPATPLPNSRAC